MSFDSYHWHDASTATPALEQARARVAAERDPAAFEVLLRSDDPVAVGIALDQYHYADASTRHGTANPFDGYRDEVMTCARKVLRGAPSPESLGAGEGANHASALGAMMNLAEPEDAILILGTLERARTADLRLAAVAAASTALEKSASPSEDLIGALERIAFDEEAGADERILAISALGRTDSATATEALLHLSGCRDLRLQVRAALWLLERDPRAHRDRVAELALAWPEDAPYPAEDVLELLAEDPGEPDEP